MEPIKYISTRGNGGSVDASYAIVHGIAEDGGLFVPTSFPVMDLPMEELLKLNYKELAYEVMKLFLTDFSKDDLKYCIEHAYDSKFDDDAVAPVVYPGGTPVLELFHGATLAFKDMALSMLPYLLTCAARKQDIQEEIVILTATSGDTGKAALEGFADVPGVRIIVFYPKDGVSAIQKLQMVTQRGDNTHVVGMDGNFDDAQRSVKEIFTNPKEAEKMKNNGYIFSSANSINIGRLIPQVVYYYWAYLQMVRDGKIAMGDKLSFSVPTGNFGDILAAYYAKRIGLPVDRLICASNKNNVLTDFFTTGHYNSKREFYVTSSPSMDILVSSNLERYLYHIGDEDGKQVQLMMQALRLYGTFDFQQDKERLSQDISNGYANEEQTAETIRKVYQETGYTMDPHTAVAEYVAEEYKKAHPDCTPICIVSTASPYKFPNVILQSIAPDQFDVEMSEADKIELLSKVSETEIPERLKFVLSARIRHTMTCDKDKALATVHSILGL